MMKKIIASAIVLLALSGSSVLAHGDTTQQTTAKETTVEQESLRVINPRRDMVSGDNNTVLTFSAPEGTTVTIDVYYNTSVSNDKQNYVQAYDTIEVEIGALKRGWTEVELKKGLNKIDFTAIYKNGSEEVITRIIEVKDMEEVKQQVEKSIINTSSTEALKNIANTGGK